MRETRRERRQVRRAEARQNAPAPVAKGLRAARFAPLLIAIAGYLAYQNSLRGAFVLDDIPAISWNATIRSLGWGVLSPPVRTAVASRPLVNATLALNYAIGELDPRSYHLFNIGLHIAAALLVYGIVRRTFARIDPAGAARGTGDGIAAATAVLWVVHPLATETVDYTIQRTELLMALFVLGTLYAAIRAFASARPRGWYAAALAAFVLGLASKEIIVVAPAIVLVYDRLFVSPSWRVAWKKHWPLYAGYVVLLALFVLLVGTRLRRAFNRNVLGRPTTPWEWALTQSGVIIHYLRLVVWPAPLSADYDGWPITGSVTSVLPQLLVVTGLVALTAWGFVRNRPIAFAGVWFFLLLGPTSSFRPIPSEVAAERRMYLPLVAVVLLSVLGIRALVRWLDAPNGVGTAIIAALALTFLVMTARRNEVYRSTLTFWQDIVDKRPDNPRARIGLGFTLQRQGRSREGLPHIEEAVRLAPGNSHAHYSLGSILESLGRADEAIPHFEEAIRLYPQNAHAHYSYGRAMMRRGFLEQADQHFEAALRSQPSLTQARSALENLRLQCVP
jgi:protein O-mannosyl-transferase